MANVGWRVEIPPYLDSWMRGDRFGTVIMVGQKFTHVKMDVSGRTLRIKPENLTRV